MAVVLGFKNYLRKKLQSSENAGKQFRWAQGRKVSSREFKAFQRKHRFDKYTVCKKTGGKKFKDI